MRRAGACRPSYLEGRLRLADKERQRRQLKAVEKPGEEAALDVDVLKAREAQANANMAALLLEEASTKARPHPPSCTPAGRLA